MCHAGSYRKPHHIIWNRNFINGAPQFSTHPQGLHIFTAGVHIWVYGHRYTEPLNNSQIKNAITRLPNPHVWIQLCSSKSAPAQWMTPLVIDAHLNGGGFSWRGACPTCGFSTLSSTKICKTILLLSSCCFTTLLLVMTMLVANTNSTDWCCSLFPFFSLVCLIYCLFHSYCLQQGSPLGWSSTSQRQWGSETLRGHWALTAMFILHYFRE